MTAGVIVCNPTDETLVRNMLAHTLITNVRITITPWVDPGVLIMINGPHRAHVAFNHTGLVREVMIL